MRRVLSRSQFRRFRMMVFSALLFGLFAILPSKLSNAQGYFFGGESYDLYDKKEFGKGFIEEYSNKEDFCHR